MKALIFGVTGQDGSYLSEFLLEKGYEVVGVSRRSSTDNTERLKGILDNKRFKLIEGDVTDYISISRIIEDVNPDEVYNLAAQSHVQTSFNEPHHTWRVDAEGPLNILESIRRHAPSCKFYQASTSEMFGRSVDEDKYQRETTIFSPQSPYAIAKVAAHHKVALYREAYGLYACSGILFNHESERRGEKFVSRKITKWVAEFDKWRNQEFAMVGRVSFINQAEEDDIYYGIPSHGPMTFPKLRLGNLDAHRDWGYAPDYVRAMWLMLQQEEPDDFVIATGITRTVRDFVRLAFSVVGIDNWEDYIIIDPDFYRPCEVEFLNGDSSRAQETLGWTIEVPFKEMVERMVKNDIGQIVEWTHTQ